MLKSYSFTIPRSEILNLYMGTVHEITIHSISEWLKSKTYKQFIVIEREFVMDAIQYIEINKYSDGFLGRDIREKWDLKTIKSYL
jgi:hypothetical protein